MGKHFGMLKNIHWGATCSDALEFIVEWLFGSDNTNNEKKNRNFWEQALKWAIAIVFIFLVGDWRSVKEFLVQHQNEVESRRTSINSPEGRVLLHEIKTAMTETREKVEEGKITAEFVAEQQSRVIDAAVRLEVSWAPYTTWIYQTSAKSYVDHWQPIASDPYGWMDPVMGEAMLIGDFGREVSAIRDSKQAFTDDQVVTALVTFLLWLIKWYCLFMIPSVLIVLLNFWLSNHNLKQEIILNWREILWRTVFWPFGLSLDLDGPILARRYYHLEWQYLRTQNKSRYDLTDQEQASLWLQAQEPVLRFDEAMSQVKQAGFVARRPVTVVVLVWVMSILNFPRQSSTVTSDVCVVFSQTFGNEDWKKGDGESQKGDDHFLSLLAMFAPGSVDIVRVIGLEEVVKNQTDRLMECFLESYRPRGPPTTSDDDELTFFSWLSKTTKE